VRETPPSAAGRKFNLMNWDIRDKEELVSLTERWSRINDQLSDFEPGLRVQSDMIASSTLLSNFDFRAGNLRRVIGLRFYENQRRDSSLSVRFEFLCNYELPPRVQPPEYTIDSINLRKGSELSNYRLVSPLRLCSPPDEASMHAYLQAPSVPSNKSLASVDPTRILIEWRSYRAAQDAATQQKAKDQALRIVSDLSLSNKPPLLRTLDCIGLVQDWDDQKFGYVFEMPKNADRAIGPISLYSCLRRARLSDRPLPLPTLGDRILLARSLAYSLTELHFTGILHRDLHSGNVLIFKDYASGRLAMHDPYIGGFGISRPEQDDSLSISTSHVPFDEFRHPELRDPSLVLADGQHTSFRRRYDVYSLGLVLLEVGLWKPISSFLPKGLSATESARKLLSAARLNLAHHMGVKYSEAVVECINFERPWMVNASASAAVSEKTDRETLFRNDDERSMDFLVLFVEKVVRRLEACQCRV
jgi:hypothetical protein